MKHDQLRSIAHNLADSLASGIGLLIGVYEMDIFAEAADGLQGYVDVDFLQGKAIGSPISASLGDAIHRYKEALPNFCEKQGVAVSAFRQLTARYSTDRRGERWIVVTVEDEMGRKSVDEYLGVPGRRLKVIDSLGRIRTDRRPRKG